MVAQCATTPNVGRAWFVSRRLARVGAYQPAAIRRTRPAAAGVPAHPDQSAARRTGQAHPRGTPALLWIPADAATVTPRADDVTLTAAQLVYTNVEKQYSSAGRDGYQVWLRSQESLGHGDETALTTRHGDFEIRDVGEDRRARHLSFTLPSSRVGLDRTVPLAETDKFSRAGRFYVHAVVIGANEFRKLGNDPFAVLDQVTFQSSLEDGAKSGDVKNGTL